MVAARLAAVAAIEAVSDVMSGRDRRALCLIRPPGHHALRGDGMGFCIFANVSLAAAEALQRFGLNRVLIVDFDVHHGNGTQEIYYDSERVGFLSIHRFPFYPGTGTKNQTGTGAGLGHTLNIPLAHGTPQSQYHASFRAGLHSLADRIKPELVLVSAGFDAHAEDPVGDLGLEVEDFETITREIVDVAEAHAAGPDPQRARGRIQRAHPRRLRGGASTRPGRRTGSGLTGAKVTVGRRAIARLVTPTGFEPVLHA